ncbi:hypothetical protein [Exiguobacterium undae]|uniref:Uncharacterized protein n=1 Tax=Exiguobacterium undae TaxID=169177 RepID=A0ABX2V601_9BACL|nr:hypothetical protein [Exiguobacterium undae]OAN10119.1 hypothetical protein A3783_15255 [Exiguobacterium undae]
MRKLIIFHKNTYKPKPIKERFKTKEFAISVSWIVAFLLSVIFVPLLNKQFSLAILWLIPALVAIGMYRHFNYLERETEFFVNDDEEYKKSLKAFLNNINIINSAQLDVLIKSLVEERDSNRKQMGVALPFVVIGVTLISIISNKVQITNKELIVYFVIYFIAVFVLHAILKMCEPFFNLYADNVSTLINFLKQIQIEWLDDRSTDIANNVVLDEGDERKPEGEKLLVEIEDENVLNLTETNQLS